MITRIKNSLGFRASRWHQERLLANPHISVRSYFKYRSEIHTYTTQDELLLLADFAALVPPESSIVEIGSYVGASTRYLVYGSRQAKPDIVCVDTWMNETMPTGNRDTLDEFNKNLDPHMDRIKSLRSDSNLISPRQLPDSIGLAFIDGDHSYKAVKHDLSLIKSQMHVNGYIAFHDITAFEGVSRCVGELLSEGKHKIAAYVNNLIIVKSEQFSK